MQRGRKPDPFGKAARGTEQPCRDVHALIDTNSPALSITAPAGLPDAAVEVWADYIGAAASHGARQCDADSFAEWCTMTAILRAARSKGEAAPASYVQQWRSLGELFGLAGPKSRIMAKGAAPAERAGNRFAGNGRR